MLFICVVRTPAQGNAPSPSTDEVVRVNTDLVTIPVFVKDARGGRISGLTQNDFEVRENGRVIKTDYFAAGTDKVALLFLLDASGSTRDIITGQRETALALFTHFGAGSRVATMQFTERPALTAPFTIDARQARAVFRTTPEANRHTAIFDAALAAVRAFVESKSPPTERRIVILISDGLDTASTTRASAAISEAVAHGVSFYVIQFPLYTPLDGRLVARRASKGFRELADKTGGQFFVVGNARDSLDPHAEYDLRPIFRAISDDLAGQYVLGYYAGEGTRDAQTHRLEVRITSEDKRRLRVHQLREDYTLKR